MGELTGEATGASESGLGESGSPAACSDRAMAQRGLETPMDERFSGFVASHRTRALRMAWRLTGGDAAAAEDVVQDAFVNAYRSLDQFRGDAKLETWFYRILLRQAANHRRWKAVRKRWHGVFRDDVADPSPPAHGDPALRRRIGDALGRLTQRQREVFVLVHMEGFTVREAAELLGSPPGTLKSHLHRALLRLREQLGDLRDRQPGTLEDENLSIPTKDSQ